MPLFGGRKEGIVAGGGDGEGENCRGALFSCCLPRDELTFAASSSPSSSDELESEESDDDDEDEDDEDGEDECPGSVFVVGSAIFVVVFGVSSLLESEDESDDELEETARLLRFLFLFLCVEGFVAAGDIFCEGEKKHLTFWGRRKASTCHLYGKADRSLIRP